MKEEEEKENEWVEIGTRKRKRRDNDDKTTNKTGIIWQNIGAGANLTQDNKSAGSHISRTHAHTLDAAKIHYV